MLPIGIVVAIVLFALVLYARHRIILSDNAWLENELNKWEVADREWDWPLAPDLSHRRGISHLSRGDNVDFKKYLAEKF